MFICKDMNSIPWRKITKNNMDEVEDPIRLGHVVSVEHIKYLIPGLISQMTGLFNPNIYQYGTVYVDQASRLSCVYPQKTASTEETL